MISKYDGTCFYCKDKTKAGKDSYDLQKKISFHEACQENVSALDEATGEIEGGSALADRLGFE